MVGAAHAEPPNPRDVALGSQLLLWKLADRGCRLQPDNEVVTRRTSGYHRLSLREHQIRSRQLAGALSAWGVKVGDRVATFMANNARHLQAYHALPGMGAVLHTLNIRLSPRELSYIIRHARDRVLLLDAELLPQAELLPAEAVAQIEMFVVCGADQRAGGWSCALPSARVVDYDAFLNSQPEAFAWRELPEVAPMGLCYTSGTTGEPKGVMYSHRSTYLTSLMIAMTTHAAMSPLDAFLCVVPMFHGMGWTMPYTAMMLGIKICFCGANSTPADQLETCLDEGVTISGGVPTVWQQIRTFLQESPDKYKGKLQLNRLVVGGSAPPMELMEWYLREYGIEMMQGWGMTETNPAGALSKMRAKTKHSNWTAEQQFRNIQCPGLILPIMEMKIVDPEDYSRELPHDGVATGELLVRGANVTGEYFQNPSAADKFHEGWLITGDVAKITPEEEIVIADRSKDLIKSGGEWISSKDVENHIMSLPGVANACVVAVPHPKWDERPVAVVEGTGDKEGITAAAILEHCSSALAKYEVPDEVLFWSSIPLTSTGKLDKKLVRQRLQEEGYVLPSLRPQAKL